MMSKETQIVRNSLISLALAAAIPAAWADQAHIAASPVHRVVTAPPRPALDLTVPDIRTVMSAEELNAPLQDPNDVELMSPETVQVHGAHPSPFVPGGFEALWWGAMHPAQAWRILTPAQ
jgi:hypothetical protein